MSLWQGINWEWSRVFLNVYRTTGSFPKPATTQALTPASFEPTTAVCCKQIRSLYLSLQWQSRDNVEGWSIRLMSTSCLRIQAVSRWNHREAPSALPHNTDDGMSNQVHNHRYMLAETLAKAAFRVFHATSGFSNGSSEKFGVD